MNSFIAYASNHDAITCSGVGNIGNLTDLINSFTCIILDSVVPFLFALSVVSFVYGIIKFFLYPDNEEKRKSGKAYMFWGLVTLFVMLSIWSIVGIFSNTFLDGRTVLPGLPE